MSIVSFINIVTRATIATRATGETMSVHDKKLRQLKEAYDKTVVNNNMGMHEEDPVAEPIPDTPDVAPETTPDTSMPPEVKKKIDHLHEMGFETEIQHEFPGEDDERFAIIVRHPINPESYGYYYTHVGYGKQHHDDDQDFLGLPMRAIIQEIIMEIVSDTCRDAYNSGIR